MFKILQLPAELIGSEQPSWDIIRLIVQAQYQITAIGIVFLVAIVAALLVISWIGVFRPARKIVTDAKKEMNTIKVEIKENVQTEIQMLKGDKDRLFALFAEQVNAWRLVVVWSGCGIEDYAKAHKEDYVEIMTHFLEQGLRNTDFISKPDKSNLLERINYIPERLKEKKEEIRELINKLPEKP